MRRLVIAFLMFVVSGMAATYGPYNGSFIRDGVGLQKKIRASEANKWSMYLWFRMDQPLSGPSLLAGVDERYLGIVDGHLEFSEGNGTRLSTTSSLGANPWHFAAATYDGTTLKLYSDGAPAGQTAVKLTHGAALMTLAPETLPWPNGAHFAGRILGFAWETDVLPEARIRALGETHEDFELARFEHGSKCWPVQTRAQSGYKAPQDPGTLPKSAVGFSKPVAIQPTAGPALEPRGSSEWALVGAWSLIEEPKVGAMAPDISKVGFSSSAWMRATVPGTVLTTMIDRGIYPDPDYGLNNMAIPESLSSQDYWYRTEFTAPVLHKGQHFTLTFKGINYAAEVWLNGQRLGDIKGAFVRGAFDLSTVQPGSKNALAVRISPPPHPGIGHEQSIKAGPGENGGAMCLDGPTFVCTEGWDWIPAVRDRNTGIWQDVILSAGGAVTIGDPRVITKLPLPSTDRAEVTIHIPLINGSRQAEATVVHASFEGIELSKPVRAAPGRSEVVLSTAVAHPRLWWPNGYGNRSSII